MAERAGISRATLVSIEKGASSVAIGCYADVLHALNYMDKDLLYRLIMETRDSIIQKRFGGRLSKKEIEIERAMIVSNVI